MKDKPRDNRRPPRRDFNAPRPEGDRPPQREGGGYGQRDGGGGAAGGGGRPFRYNDRNGPPPRRFDDRGPPPRRDFDGPPREGGDRPPPRRDFDGPPRRDFNGPPRRDFNGPPPPRRDFDRPPPRRDFDGPPREGGDRPPPRRDFDGPPPRRDFDRPPPRRDFDGPRRFDDRGPPRRDFDGPPPRRDFDRPPPRRDFDGPPPRRDFDGPPRRDFDGPPRRNFDGPPPRRDFDRPPPRRDFDRPRPQPEGGFRDDRGQRFDDRGEEFRPQRKVFRADDLRDAPAFAPNSAPVDAAEGRSQGDGEGDRYDSDGTVLVYGLRAALATFAKRPEDVTRIWHTEATRHQLGEVLREAAKRHISYSEGDDAELTRVSGAVHHEGLLMRVRPQQDLSIELLAETLVRTRGAVIALDRVNNPHNLGAVLRSAAYFGCAGVLYSPSGESRGLTASAARVSEGGAEHVPVVQTDDLADALRRLRAKGVRVVGTDAKATKTSFDESWPRPTVVVIGNEREGLRPTVRLECDDTISIPGTGDIESLNASVAAGVLLADLARTAKGAKAYEREGALSDPKIAAANRPEPAEEPKKKKKKKKAEAAEGAGDEKPEGAGDE